MRIGRRRTSPIGVVLAGGRGRRIGGDKAMVQLEGRPLLEYPLAALGAVLGDVAVVAKRETRVPRLDRRVSLWLEPDEPSGVLAAIVHALREADGRPIVAVGCDLPFVTPTVVRTLVEADAHGAPAVIPVVDGRARPLCARYDRGALAALEALDASMGVDAIAEAIGATTLAFADADPFLEVNAPEDVLHAAVRLGARA